MSSFHVLQLHPVSSCRGVHALAARLDRSDDGVLSVVYRLQAEGQQLRLPPTGPGARVDGLWQHTCFELFVAAADGSYHEFNFAPSGDWHAYRFSAYRQRAATQPDAAPRITVERTGPLLTLAARIPRAALPAHPHQAGLSAVIEEAGGRLSYWALHHPSDAPDFHNAAGFVVAL